MLFLASRGDLGYIYLTVICECLTETTKHYPPPASSKLTGGFSCTARLFLSLLAHRTTHTRQHPGVRLLGVEKDSPRSDLKPRKPLFPQGVQSGLADRVPPRNCRTADQNRLATLMLRFSSHGHLIACSEKPQKTGSHCRASN